ncbi:cytochrome c oxidase subunit 4 isoform 2, mitochondrial-like [Hydra vulgaris]|uniref:Cytochrome c oxidase subunit 4 isoform 2, mitochondrial-like n=1 Tax=Hydra vulgaris TaxID=6087 RepID=A0ABM4DJV6_HYDVU
MASLIRVKFGTSTVIGRRTASAVAHAIGPDTRYCPANPASLERTGVVSEALLAKEKGPWNKLSKEDKIALYRAQFPKTMKEAENVKGDTGKVVFGVSIGVAVALCFYSILNKFVAPELPRTFTKEWQEASKEKMKLYNMNPIFGVSSKK